MKGSIKGEFVILTQRKRSFKLGIIILKACEEVCTQNLRKNVTDGNDVHTTLCFH